MLTAHDLARMSRRELGDVLREGKPLGPDDLAGWAFRGVSLGLPALVERVTWKTFQKAFVGDARGVRGWNVRVEQRGTSAATVPRRRDGVPWTFGHFRVVDARGIAPAWCDRGVVLDYGAFASSLDPMRSVRDPLVAVSDGARDLLLGMSYVALGGTALATPSWFTLEREHPVDHVPDAPAVAATA